tara:strand:- start:1865 stop:2101 length:237 start_codon:yes stop_codon:yes gene_type:complete
VSLRTERTEEPATTIILRATFPQASSKKPTPQCPPHLTENFVVGLEIFKNEYDNTKQMDWGFPIGVWALVDSPGPFAF